MRAILFAPHNDDETLFAFYQCLRLKPKVIVVLRSFRQATEQNGPTYQVREAETDAAMEVAGCPWTQWVYPDDDPDWDKIGRHIEELLAERRWGPVIGPAYEVGGHEDHNAVADIIQRLRPDVKGYLTYVRGQGRSTGGIMVAASAEEQILKRRALACYTSQREHPPTATWFDPLGYGDLREWVA